MSDKCGWYRIATSTGSIPRVGDVAQMCAATPTKSQAGRDFASLFSRSSTARVYLYHITSRRTLSTSHSPESAKLPYSHLAALVPNHRQSTVRPCGTALSLFCQPLPQISGHPPRKITVSVSARLMDALIEHGSGLSRPQAFPSCYCHLPPSRRLIPGCLLHHVEHL